MIRKQGFTLAEALITLVIISLVMAATMPIVIKSQNSPSEAPFKFVTMGDLALNSSVYSALGNTSTVVFGAKRVPVDQNIANADKALVYAAKLNPKISVVTRNRTNNPLISRHLIDFYEKEIKTVGTSTEEYYTGIGKISFDDFLNLAVGANALSSIKADQLITYDSAWPTLPTETITYTSTDAANVSHNISFTNDKISYADPPGSSTIVSVEKGVGNTAVGQYSMAGNAKTYTTTAPTRNMIGNYNTALGAFSLRNLTTGNSNTALGMYAMSSNQTANAQVAIGASALKSLTTGYSNTAVGANSMQNVTTGWGNTSLGSNTLVAETTGYLNTAIGSESQTLITTGNANTSVGYNTLHKNVSGSMNIALGAEAMSETYSSSMNVAVGYEAQKNNKGGNYNISLGYDSLKMGSTNTTGSYNIAIGTQALRAVTTGGGNIGIGTNAHYNITIGTGNIAIGNNLNAVVEANNRLIIGGVTAYDTSTQALTSTRNTNVNEVFIYGEMAYDGTTKASPLLRFNTLKNEIGLGDAAETFIKGKAYITVGSTNHQIATIDDLTAMLTGATANGAVLNYTYPATIYSDARLKNIIGDNTAGLKEIQQLKVKNYTMKRDKKKEVLVGVIAQDLQKVFPNSVSEGRDGYLRIKREEIFYACVNAIKELANMFQELVARITGLEEKIRILEDRNKLNLEKIEALERQNKLLKERITVIENKRKEEKSLLKKKEEEKAAREAEKAVKNTESVIKTEKQDTVKTEPQKAEEKK